MSAPPYMRLYWGDYSRKTRHLTRAAEHGAYLMLIGALWDANGRLPADDDTLAAHALLSPKEWAALKPKIMPFFKVSRGFLTQPRVTEELAKYRDTSCKRKQAGKAGGEARAGKATGNPEANARQKPTQSESESEPKQEKETPCSPPSGDAKVKGSRTCPTDWRPKDDHFTAALEDGLTRPEVEREALKFRNHDFRRPIKNWDRAFANWLIKALEIRQERNRPPPVQRRVGWV